MTTQLQKQLRGFSSKGAWMRAGTSLREPWLGVTQGVFSVFAKRVKRCLKGMAVFLARTLLFATFGSSETVESRKSIAILSIACAIALSPAAFAGRHGAALKKAKPRTEPLRSEANKSIASDSAKADGYTVKCTASSNKLKFKYLMYGPTVIEQSLNGAIEGERVIFVKCLANITIIIASKSILLCDGYEDVLHKSSSNMNIRINIESLNKNEDEIIAGAVGKTRIFFLTKKGLLGVNKIGENGMTDADNEISFYSLSNLKGNIKFFTLGDLLFIRENGHLRYLLAGFEGKKNALFTIDDRLPAPEKLSEDEVKFLIDSLKEKAGVGAGTAPGGAEDARGSAQGHP